jgi:hypothetical protein
VYNLDSFTYLSVLLSLVLGLGITNLLTGLALLVRQRRRVALYWPVPVWIITLFLIHVQTWWAMFGLRTIVHWGFGAFLIILLQPVALFVMTALITPDLSGPAPVDLRAAYFRENRWFFSALLMALCASLAKNRILYGAFPEPANFVAHCIFFGIALVGAIFRSDRIHKVMAPLGLVFIGSYIALLFTTLL